MLSNPNPTLNAKLNSNFASDEETGTPHNSNNKTKKSSIRDSDDPEWIPEKKMKRTPKLKPHTAATETTTNTMEEQQKPEQQSPVLALEARPTSVSPPQYLISLLGFFGWKVGFRPATRDYVYQSPNGMSYHSLPKAFETFLDGNSKYKEKPWLLKSGTSGTSSIAGKRPLVQEKKKTGGMARDLPKREGDTEPVKRNKKNVSNDQTKSSTQASRRPPPRPVRRSTRTDPSEKTETKLKTKSRPETKGGSVPKVDKKTDQKPGTSNSKATGNGNNMAQNKDERGKVCEAGGLQLREYHNTGVPRCILTARSKTENNSDNKNNNKPSTKLTILSKLIETGTLTDNQPVMYVSEDNGRGTGTSILSGKVTRDGIFCDCCQETITVQEFESHAGSDAKKPWENVFLASGKTLLNCLGEGWNSARQSEKLESTKGKEKNMEMYEEGDESDDTCGICADGGRLICCDGCPSTFHQECLNLEALPEGSWSCQKLATQLLDLIGISNHLEGDLCWNLLKIRENCGENMQRSVSSILGGNLKLSAGLSLLRECFLPLIDQRTSIDVLSQAIYSRGSRYNRLNYEGFYTVVLQKGEEVISLALLRFHGTKMAEMPFVGTRPIYQRQGMCHRLLKGVEQLLLLLEVEKLVVPAIPDMVNTWTKSFSFKLLEPPLKEEIKNVSLVIFAETTLLEKTVFKAQPDTQEGSSENPEPSRRTTQDTLALVPNFLYSSGFPFFPTQEILHLQQGFLATNPTPSFQGHLHGGNSLDASGSIFAPSSSDALQAFDDAVYSNMSFESLLRMAD
ncbi:Acyl-CoA N-acyltransferase with RING/FYVE/PHD-type zinc finger protein [Rhynchospora pubera]|uniref:Acyl-CoA N-acyltransferase with RING/FYVE/PHD-type zinc finger protein n=1 Tax=Rhynchospora pubera TaxID=906938 RepID=A0AAV8BZI0_9POAL|nr:Acyl-CoA N-acyltransferase with RING/FYVE/PHD-type zinc finger protein [Rhynchospora pubera]